MAWADHLTKVVESAFPNPPASQAPSSQQLAAAATASLGSCCCCWLEAAATAAEDRARAAAAVVVGKAWQSRIVPDCSGTERLLYFNPLTGRGTFTLPPQADICMAWKHYRDQTGCPYWHNGLTQEVSCQMPAGWVANTVHQQHTNTAPAAWPPAAAAAAVPPQQPLRHCCRLVWWFRRWSMTSGCTRTLAGTCRGPSAALTSWTGLKKVCGPSILAGGGGATRQASFRPTGWHWQRDWKT
jgi:hypothetical protein